MNSQWYSEEKEKARPFREAYRDGIEAYAEKLRKETERKRDVTITPEKMGTDREFYRKKLISLIGEPLAGYSPTICPYRIISLYADEETEIFRVTLQMPENIPFTGLLFLPSRGENGKTPLILAMHGLEGTPELASDVYSPNRYSHMCRRLLKYGAAVFAPQTLMWNAKEFGSPCDRNETDARLRMTGLSVNALELLFLRRTIDTFCDQKRIDSEKIGVCGLSYGAYFSVMLAAVDPRIKAVYSSCFFSDRYVYPRPEMVFPGLFPLFGDAETAALICPRRLYIEAGEHDCFFAPEYAKREFEKLRAYYEADGCGQNLRFSLHPGGHYLSPTDEGMDFFFSGWNGTKF